MKYDLLRKSAILAALGALPLHAAAVELSVSLEAFKSAEVDAFDPEDTFDEPLDLLAGHEELFSYIAFDLSDVPAGFQIVDAQVDVFDAEPLLEDVNQIALLDVETDWDASTLTYNLAIEDYGAEFALNDDDIEISAYDASKVLWFGSAIMDNQDPPGNATIGSTRAFQADTLEGTEYTKQDLIDALNAELANGDGLVTMAIRGTTPDDNFLIGIGYTDGEQGPTLTLTVDQAADSGSATTYNFDDGTLQRWTQVMGSTTENGPANLGLIGDNDPTVGNSVPPVSQTAPYFLGPVPFEAEDNTNTRDQAHETLLVRSPEFRIFPNGQISFGIIGGSKPNFDIDAINANGLPTDSSGDGAIGMALRRASDGQYVGYWHRSDDGSQFWETITIGSEDLAGVVSGDEMYTLDFVDFHNGGWGWAAIDSVVIVEGNGANYNFDNGTLQGWTQVSVSELENGPTHLGILGDNDPAVGDSVPPVSQTAPYFVGPVPFEAEDNTNTRDQAHDTLVVRSPEFQIFPNGQISFGIIGGSKPNFDIDAINANGLPTSSSGDGAIGVALRRVADSQYLGFWSRSDDGSQFWETVTIGSDELADLVNPDDRYTLDFIDFHNGGLAWAAIDSVNILRGGTSSQLDYGFDNGDLDGWTQVLTSTTENGPTALGLIRDDDPAVGDSVPPVSQTAPGLMGPVPFEAEDNTNTRDQAHQTLLTRSPAFQIFPNGGISFGIIGGSKPNFDIDAINANGLPTDSSSDGAIGVALRRESDGQYLAFWSRSDDGSQFWETITIGEDELSALVSAEETYTLDFIDSHNGGWGWAAIDSVLVIPGSDESGSGEDPRGIAGVSVVDGVLSITFEGSLQSAPTVVGPWSDIEANESYETQITQEQAYFRVAGDE